MEEASVTIEAEINPTESEDRVRRAIESMFGNVQTRVEPLQRGAKVSAENKDSEALTKLYELQKKAKEE